MRVINNNGHTEARLRTQRNRWNHWTTHSKCSRGYRCPLSGQYTLNRSGLPICSYTGVTCSISASTPSGGILLSRGEEILHEFVREDDRCIYNIEKDAVDVQGVPIEYENGAVANFMLNFHGMGPKAGRNFHAIGTKGMIWGSFQDKTVYLHDNLSGETSTFYTSGGGSGHGRGDQAHALLLGAMMGDPGYAPDQNAPAGYLSAVMCLAADVSRTQQRRVEFTHKPDGLVTFG